MQTVVCYNCKTKTQGERIGFREDCDQCGEDLHICYNCEFYDENSYNECREPSADRVKDKDRSNLCDFFSPKGTSGSGEGSKKEDLLAQAEALFSKK